MKIVEFYNCDNRDHWLNEIKRSDWDAGQFLFELLRDDRLKKLCGERTRVFLLTDGEKLVSFCTYAEQDDIREPSLTPWAGFVYTFPEYRGKRYMGSLLNRAREQAVEDKYEYLYISTGETGLYEKYGYSFWKNMKDVNGEDSRVYRKHTGGIMLETDRLILRRWKDGDAEELYKYASDPDVGPIAGWPAHQSIDESRDVIRNVLNGKEAYAICLKEDGKAIGAIELKLNGHTDLTDQDYECEMGYWLGKPFWGRGIMPEAVKELLRHAFEDCGMQKVWIAYYEGNSKSKRVQEKCGFRYQWRSENVDVPLMNEKRTGHVSCMTREDWMSDRSL